MALIDNLEGTKNEMKTTFLAKMEELFPLPADISEDGKNNIRNNWQKMGEAIAEILVPICEHIVSKAEIGTIISDVVDSTATQNNVGKGLIR